MGGDFQAPPHKAPGGGVRASRIWGHHTGNLAPCQAICGDPSENRGFRGDPSRSPLNAGEPQREDARPRPACWPTSRGTRVISWAGGAVLA